jgi:LAO/AO transport system ATPase
MNAPGHPLVAPILAGDRRSIARAITAVETESAAGASLLEALAPDRGRSHVVGVTGPPGVGKSTLIDRLLGELLARGRRIGVVAVDPSSPVSGGAVLGDRVRMGRHGDDDRVFIRSVASRGHLGGVSRTTGRILDVLDAARFDPILVETVGTGQSEVEVHDLADTRVVVCAPGLGDDIQAIKAGVLEIADVLVVNRGDSPLAADTERALREMLRLRRRGPWQVLVVRTTATTGEGVAALVDAIEAHAAFAGRGRRLRVRPAATIDDVAAVDRAITTRRSVRAFLPRPVPRATVERILAVATRAPSGTNTQPWKVYALAGAAKARLTQAIAAAFDAGESTREFDYYPTKWFEPYLGRRRKIGWDLYGLLGIGRGDKAKSHAQHRRNYLFFDAPVGLVFTIDRDLETGSWLDYGMFLENVMVAARARGLDTCPQAAWMEFPQQIAELLGLAPNEQVVCGMALGYADPDAIENRLVTEREPVAGFARFDGFDDDGGEPHG